MNARLAGLGVFVLAVGLCSDVTPAAADQAPATVPNFSGHWKLNKELSDKPPAAPAEKNVAKLPAADKDESQTGGRGGRKQASAPPPPVTAATPTPSEPIAELTVRQTDVEIAVEDKPGQVRSFYPNGKTYKTDEGASNMTSAWKNGALLFEKKNVRGWRLTELWQVTPDGKQIKVESRVEGGGYKKTVTKRVYDRVTEPAPAK